MLAFDEVPLSYACPEGADGDLKPMAPVAFNSENFSTYIGVTKFVDPTELREKGAVADINNESLHDSEAEDAGAEGFDSDTEEVDERRHLRAYWRADEGRGNKVHDLFEKELHLELDGAELVWHQEPNPDGEPLEYEDKWGKSNTPNFAFEVPTEGFALQNKKMAVSAKTGNFTLELWLRESNQVNEMLVLALLTDVDHMSLFLMRE